MCNDSSIESVIDLNTWEESALSDLLGEVCQEFPNRSREELLALVCSRLTKRLSRGEIAYKWDSGKEVTPGEALALLRLPETWEGGGAQDDCLRAVHIWSYDRRSPCTTWLRYCCTALFKRQE
jgi:hypothetical protein